MLRFYWRLVKRTPLLLWRTLTGLDKVMGALTIALSAIGIGAWQQLFPVWLPFAAFGVILLYGFLRANYEEYLAVEGERDELRVSVETEEKRAAIAAELQQLYWDGSGLKAEIVNSDDETSANECQEKFVRWCDRVFEFLYANVSVGKAEYVDGVSSVRAASISGMKSHLTRREKEGIVLYLNERLNRLAEVLKGY